MPASKGDNNCCWKMVCQGDLPHNLPCKPRLTLLAGNPVGGQCHTPPYSFCIWLGTLVNRLDCIIPDLSRQAFCLLYGYCSLKMAIRNHAVFEESISWRPNRNSCSVCRFKKVKTVVLVWRVMVTDHTRRPNLALEGLALVGSCWFSGLQL